MKTINSLLEIKTSKEEKFSVAIGNFDGFHKGHFFFINKFVERSKQLNLKSILVTFNPHPLKVINKSSFKNYLISSAEDKNNFLKKFSVDYLYVINFTQEISLLNADKFIRDYFLKYIKVGLFFLGEDSTLGHNKTGKVENLKKYFSKEDILFEVSDFLYDEGRKVSSSLIRNEIQQGNLHLIPNILGREFSLDGKVESGLKKGGKIGFPTINLCFDQDRIVPGLGVYLTKTNIGGKIYNSITNVGLNPTVSDNSNLKVETHILNFNGSVYGESAKIIFIKKIRDEKKFSSIEKLVEQITKDVESAKKYFS